MNERECECSTNVADECHMGLNCKVNARFDRAIEREKSPEFTEETNIVGWLTLLRNADSLAGRISNAALKKIEELEAFNKELQDSNRTLLQHVATQAADYYEQMEEFAAQNEELRAALKKAGEAMAKSFAPNGDDHKLLRDAELLVESILATPSPAAEILRARDEDLLEYAVSFVLENGCTEFVNKVRAGHFLLEK